MDKNRLLEHDMVRFLSIYSSVGMVLVFQPFLLKRVLILFVLRTTKPSLQIDTKVAT
jgi:hypothetical protein